MLKFTKLTREKLTEVAPYFAAQTSHISDFSVGFQYMWAKYLNPDYAFVGNCLVIKELYAGKHFYHYPISIAATDEERLEEERVALFEIEKHCKDGDERLHYTNVPRCRVGEMATVYGNEVLITNPRRWRDYLYPAENFKTYAGGKFSGQRNHVNKFKKNYPDWAFHVYKPEDESAVFAFLKEYESSQRAKHAFLAEEEMDEVYEILPNIAALGLLGGYLTVGGRIVAASFGERCGDMIVVHIEKALREYEGAYPMMAQQFALAFCDGRCLYLNRMDDAGDRGLRKSKLQYLPCELVDKYNVTPKRAIDGVSRLPVLKTERLKLAAVKEDDLNDYARLCRDTERNKYWGYDYREDETNPADEWFLQLARSDFKHKFEMPLGIYCGGKLVGEAVLHRFGYRSEAEAGVRLLPEAEGNGYATEAMRALAEYAFYTLGLERVEAKCYRENVKSDRMLRAAGFRPCGEDEKFYYFYMTAAM